MMQRINLNQNNRSVVAHGYPTLCEKTDPILPTLVGRKAGRQAGTGWQMKYG